MSSALYFNAVRALVSTLSSNPLLLRRDIATLTDIKSKLHSQGDTASQGSGNQVTDQESCFAATLEENGFKYSSSKLPPTNDGFYYIYQVNGTQRSIDFQIFNYMKGIKRHSFNFDLKHTKNDIFFLNDGWFHRNIIYVVSWMRKISEPRKKKVVEPATFIALGQNIPTEEEIALYNDLCEIKKKYNTEYKGSGSFHCYIRFANTYKCDRFTPEHTTENLESVLAFIAPKKKPVIAGSVCSSFNDDNVSDISSVASGSSE